METYLFDDRDSIIHAVLGFIFVLLPLIGILGWPVFVYYEWQEFEDPVATVGDVLEAVVGMIEGWIFHLLLNAGPYLTHI